MKRPKQKLQLKAQTVAKLSEQNLAQVRGGSIIIDSELQDTDKCLVHTTQGSVHTGGCAGW